MDISKFSNIYFPSFGIEINPPRGIIIFGFDIRFYAILLVIGMISALVYGLIRCKDFGLNDEEMMDGFLIIVPFALICARLYYCIFSWEHYAANPASILNIREGGLAIYGGIIGGVLGIIAFCKIKKIPVGAVLDVSLMSLMLSQAIGRWGNFFNREAFGAETSNFLRMGLYNTVTNEYTYHHPTFLYESIWNLIGFTLLHFLSKKRKYDGQVALSYAAWYGLGRTFIEGLRMDSLYLGQFRVSQLLSIAIFLASVTTMTVMVFKNPDPKNLLVNRVAQQQEKVATKKNKSKSKKNK